MSKTLKIINIVFAILIAIGDVFYITGDNVWVKGLTSALFVVLGTINLVYAIKNKTSNLKFCIIILVGLFFAMLGDILLEIEFIVGAILFAVGHVFFFVSYLQLVRFKWKDLLCALIIAIPSILIITLVPIFNFGGVLMEIVCVCYAVIISCMVGKAVSNYITVRSSLHLIILIGSALFFFSDLMLLFNVFGHVGKVFGVLCLLTYYPAEFILAYSIKHTCKKIKLISCYFGH